MECRRWFSNFSTFSLSNCPTPAGGAVRIAVDAMGGDHAPDVVVAGAVAAVRDLGAEVVLVGPQARVEREMARYRPVPSGLSVVDAPEVIEMHESPAMAVRRKKRASIVVAMELVRDRRADAAVSAGHTGAAMGAALLRLGRIPGVARPAIAVVLPTVVSHPVVLLDVGANVDCRPHHLLQFAIMGAGDPRHREVGVTRAARPAGPAVSRPAGRKDPPHVPADRLPGIRWGAAARAGGGLRHCPREQQRARHQECDPGGGGSGAPRIRG